MRIRLNIAQIVAVFLAFLFAVCAFLAYDPQDTAGAALLGFLAVLSGFVVYCEQGLNIAVDEAGFGPDSPTTRKEDED